MRTIVVGNRALAKHVLEHLLRNDWNIVGAVSASGSAARKQAGYVPFDDLAKNHAIKVIETSDINSQESKRHLEDLDPDLCICPGWHQIIDSSILRIPDRGFVGFHASDLPRGRGGAPINWSIINNESQITLSLFYYSDGVDDGDIIQKHSVRIEERDDVNTVLDRLSVAACDILSTIREDIEDNIIEATSQLIEKATYRPRRQPQDGIINWSSTTAELIDWIRGQTDPYPGAYTFLYGDRVVVWSADPLNKQYDDATPGTVHSICEGEGIDVATQDGALRLKRVQKDGYPRMWGDNFADRYNITHADTFGRHHAPESWTYTGIRDSSGGIDFRSSTNIDIGETGEVRAVVCSPTAVTMVRIEASLGDQNIRNKQIECTDQTAIPIEYAPRSAGTHTLSIRFFNEREKVDTRYLKIFVS